MHSGCDWERETLACPGAPAQRPSKQEIHMFTLNQRTIIGFTGREADTHYTTNGTLVTTLSVATKES